MAREGWIDTGIDVGAGDALQVTATGAVVINSRSTASSPDGEPACADAELPGGFPAPTLPCWSLIGRLGQGEPFLIGSSYDARPGTGRLWLRINDDNLEDNEGSWSYQASVLADARDGASAD